MHSKIRKAQIEEKRSVNDAHVRSIREVVAKDYNHEQIEAWASLEYTDDVWQNTLVNDHYRVVEIDGVIEGFCHSRIHENGRGEVMGLYLAPGATGRGIGREMFEMARLWFQKNDVEEVDVTATRTALGFYQHMGFELKGEAPNHEIRGVAVQAFSLTLKV